MIKAFFTCYIVDDNCDTSVSMLIGIFLASGIPDIYQVLLAVEFKEIFFISRPIVGRWTSATYKLKRETQLRVHPYLQKSGPRKQLIN